MALTSLTSLTSPFEKLSYYKNQVIEENGKYKDEISCILDP